MKTTPEALADSNFVASVRAHARWQQPCDSSEQGGVLCVAGLFVHAAQQPGCRFGYLSAATGPQAGARCEVDAVAVNAQAYEALQLPAAQTLLYFGNPDALLAPDVDGFVAYRDGVPVGTALTLVNGEAAGIYWVGTVAAARGAGLGELCTRLATNAGFARGARVVTLQASPFGEPIYRRMGYRVYDQYHRYICP